MTKSKKKEKIIAQVKKVAQDSGKADRNMNGIENQVSDCMNNITNKCSDNSVSINMNINNGINRPVFDMIRTAAVLMVFTIHFLGYRNVEVPLFVFRFFEHCSYGVSFFFAISGYLIMQSVNGSRNIKEYFVKRVSRIIPAYYAILVFGIIVWDICLGKMPADSMLGLGWLRYFLFLNVIIPSNDYYFWNDLWGLWTMSSFMLFYLLAPVIRKFVKSYKGSLLFMLIVVVVAYGSKAVIYRLMSSAGIANSAEFAGDFAVFNMISFSFGVVAWYAVKEMKDKQYLSFVILFLAGFLMIREDSYNRIIWALFAVAFMLSMKDFSYSAKTEWIGKVFSTFSKYSFTVYLIHMPILQLLEHVSDNYTYLGVLPFTILTVVLVIVVAIVVNKFIEEPFAKLIRRIIK